MSSKKRTAKQAAKDKAALKRLVKSGTYKGKVDLRKAPTKYQLKKIAELKASRAKPKQPLPPKTKTPGAKVTQKRLSKAQLEKLKPPGKYEMTTYALPFHRKGREEPEWRRFTYQQMMKFLHEYKADDPEGASEWKSYAVKESWTFPSQNERNAYRSDVNVYFSGVRIDQPKGKVIKPLKNKSAKRTPKASAKTQAKTPAKAPPKKAAKSKKSIKNVIRKVKVAVKKAVKRARKSLGSKKLSKLKIW